MKRFLAMLLAVLMIVSLLPVAAFAEEIQEVGSASALTTALANGGKIKLTDSFTSTVSFTVSKDTVIDFNGKTLTFGTAINNNSQGFLVNEGVKFDVTDSNATPGGVKMSYSNANWATTFIKNNGGTVTFDKITLNGGSVKGVVLVGGSFTMNGGTMNVTNFGVHATGGTVTINGGTLAGTDTKGRDTIYLSSGAELKMTGGTVSSTEEHAIQAANQEGYTTKVEVSGGTIEVKNSTSSSNNIFLAGNNCEAKISGGTFVNAGSGADLKIDGNDKTKIEVSGGTFDKTPAAEFVKVGAEITVGDVTYTKTEEGGEVVPTTPAGPAWEGEGTEASPYIIKNATDLNAFAAAVDGGELFADTYFKLDDNFDNSDAPLTNPIGCDDQIDEDPWEIINYFSGHFDGNGKTVTIDIDVTNNEFEYKYAYGLFAGLDENGTISNVTVDGSVDCTGSVVCFGGVCGENCGTISGCTNKADITAAAIETTDVVFNGYSFGGICGSNSGTVSGCSNEGDITGTGFDSFGGICGATGTIIDEEGTKVPCVINCTNSGNVTGTDSHNFGGVCGSVYDENWSPTYVIDGILENCTNTGTVTANGYCYEYGDIIGGLQPAKIGDKYYPTVEAALAAAQDGETVEIMLPGTYTLPASIKNITVKPYVDTESYAEPVAVEGIVFNCVGSGNICSVPDGATFENVAFNFGTAGYHGFQHAGKIVMNNCELNGLLFSYGDMEFNNCVFNAQDKADGGAEYSMWLYAGNVSFDGCTFNAPSGKFFNVYNEGNAPVKDGLKAPWNVTVKDCIAINEGNADKTVFNVKETCGATDLKYNVGFTGANVAIGDYPAASSSDTKQVINAFVQVDAKRAGGTPDGDDIVITATSAILDNSISKAQYLEIKDDPNALSNAIFNAKLGNRTTGELYSTDKEIVPTNYWTDNAASEFAKEDQTAKIIEIATPEQLAYFAQCMNNGGAGGWEADLYKDYTVKLTADIDLAGHDWVPIGGNELNKFSGTFDGQGHTIKNMTVNNKENNAGLFGCVFGGTIKNLTIENANVTNTGENYTGAIAGSGYAKIEDCTVKNSSVNGVEQVGAIIGYISSGYVKDCTVDGCTVNASGNRAGGITGKANVDSDYVISGNTVKGTTVTAANTVDGMKSAAGLVGQVMASAKNTWKITDNDIISVTTTTGTDTTFVPVGEFRSGSFQADAVTGGHIVRNHWEPATEPDSYTMVNPANAEQSVVIYNFYPVCEIVGGHGYATIAEAIADAKTGDTIKLLEDFTDTHTAAPASVEGVITIPEGKNIVLDLNGHTVDGGKFSNVAAILNNGTVKVTDSAAAKGVVKRSDLYDVTDGSKNQYPYYVIVNKGTMELDGISVYNEGYYNTGAYSYGGATLLENAAGTMTINGGNYHNKQYQVLRLEENSDVIINGGNFDSEDEYSTVQVMGSLTVNGGTFSRALKKEAGSTIVINEGNFKYDYLTYVGTNSFELVDKNQTFADGYQYQIKLKGNEPEEFDAKVVSNTGVETYYIGTTHEEGANAALSKHYTDYTVYYNYAPTNVLQLSNGSYYAWYKDGVEKDGHYTASAGFEVLSEVNEETGIIRYYTAVTENSAFAKIVRDDEDLYFWSIAYAAQNAQAGETVVVLKDDTSTTRVVGQNAVPANLTLNLNGKTIAGNLTSSKENKSLTVIDSVGTGVATSYVNNYLDTASLTIQGGTFTNYIFAQKGTITIEGGNFTGDLAEKTYDGLGYTMGSASNSGELVIKGGYFVNDPSAFVPDGYKVVESDVTGYNYKVVEKTYVAQIGETKYETLTEAIAAVSEMDGNNTIILLCDVNETPDFAPVLDLKGDVTLTAANATTATIAPTAKTSDIDNDAMFYIVSKDGGNHTFTIDNNVTLVLPATSAAKGAMYVGYQSTWATNLVVNGRIEAYLPYVGSNSTMTVNPSGSVKSISEDLIVRWGAVVNVDGTDGTWSAENPQIDLGYAEQQGGTVTFTNTFVDAGAWYGIQNRNGKADVDTKLVLDNTVLTANAFNSNAKSSGDSSAFSVELKNGSAMNIKGNATIIADGEVKLDTSSAISVKGITNNGTITVDMTGATEDSYKLIDYTGTDAMTLADYGTVTLTNAGNYFAKVVDNDLVAVKAVAQIDDQKFATLAEAIAAAQSGDTIVLVADSAEDITLTEGVIFDATGASYTGTVSAPEGYVVVNTNGVYTVKVDDSVAWNPDTKVKYATLEEALEAAAKDATAANPVTIELLKNIENEKYIIVENNVILDLKGFHIAGVAKLIYVNGTMIDSSAYDAETRGYIKATAYMFNDQKLISLDTANPMPIYDASVDGYRIAKLRFDNRYTTKEGNEVKFTLFNSTAGKYANNLIKGHYDHFKAYITVTWTETQSDGKAVQVTQSYLYNDVFMQHVMENYASSRFTSTLSGFTGTAIAQPKFVTLDSEGNELMTLYGPQFELTASTEVTD